MKRTKFPRKKPSPERGQGFTEYAIILMLVGVSVVLIITVMGPAFEGVFSRIVRQAPVAPPSIGNYTPPPTNTPSPPEGTPTETATLPPGVTPSVTPTPSITPTATETPTAAPTLTPSPTTTPAPSASNLCDDPGVSVSQSSTASGAVAAKACDGNTNGNFSAGSVSSTNNDANAWWEVNLGRTYVLQQIKLFNRTDCCSDRLSNFYVFVINDISGFPSNDLGVIRADSRVTEYYFDGDVDSLAFALGGISASHVRIQLAGTNYLSLAEVEIIGSTIVPDRCEALADMFYIFDVSGSMAWDFPGADSKIEAAKDAVITVNNAIDAANTNSRVGFVTFTTDGYYWNGSAWRYNIDLNTIPLTTDIASVNALVENWVALGGTPTGAAINAARLTMIDTWDPLRIPVVVLVSDGVPTIDQLERPYPDASVQEIVVYDPSGNPYTPAQVENTGDLYTYYSPERAGYVVAEAMREVQELTRSLPDATVHSIAIGGSGFNTEVLQYVADVGGGTSFAANSADQLADQMLSIFNAVSCDPDS